MKMILRDRAGRLKEVKIGFSWTTLFFGPFVPACRDDWNWVVIMLLFNYFTYGITLFGFPFVYNRIYIKGLIMNKGYRPTTAEDEFILRTKGFPIC